MNRVASIIDAQVQALLQMVEEHRERRCRQILEQARTEAAAAVKQAYGEARARMHQAIEEERARGEGKIASTRAQLQTQRRQREQRLDMALLAQAWEALRARLLARWQDEQARRVWVRALVHQARAVLPAQKWRIEHPVGWRSQEALALLSEESAMFLEAPDIAAGLRIRAGDACLDGTPAGLLASRAEIEAQLLAELHRNVANELAANPGGRGARPES